MWQYSAKIVVTVVLVIAVTEVAKRSSLWGAVLASLPVTSLLAFVWIYTDTGNTQAVAALSQSIFWLVLASLPLSLVFSAALQRGVAFWPALALTCAITVAAYFLLVRLLSRFDVHV